ncbi:MAG: hypothetical protein ACYS8W_15385 [Planctomycetota bacterium]|jgi:hypothetical protein
MKSYVLPGIIVLIALIVLMFFFLALHIFFLPPQGAGEEESPAVGTEPPGGWMPPLSAVPKLNKAETDKKPEALKPVPREPDKSSKPFDMRVYGLSGPYVNVTGSDMKYHSGSCRHVKDTLPCIERTARKDMKPGCCYFLRPRKAKELGYEPCQECKPPE